MKKIYLFAILSMTAWLANAQQLNYNFYNYSAVNGLPTNDYQCIYQDSYGFLWLASYDGLFRWDGYSFKKYYHDERNPGSLNGNIVYAIFEDSHRRLWIGTIGGLNLYDRARDEFIQCTVGQKDEKIPVNAILEDRRHQLWLGTSMGLCRYDYNRRTSTWFPGQKDENVIFCMAIDTADNIWVGTFNEGIRKFTQATRVFQNFRNVKGNRQSLSSNKIKSILVDDKNNIWAGTSDRGITVLNDRGEVLRQYDNFPGAEPITQNNINCLYEDQNQTIWIGLQRGPLYYIRKGSLTLKALAETACNNNHEQLSSISSIREDSFGNTWFASAEYGLFYTNKNKNTFRNYLQDPNIIKGLKTTVITCFHEDKNGKIWIGTNGGGFLKFSPLKDSFTLFNTPALKLSSNAINDIKEDDNGKLWMATWGGGIIRFDPVSLQVKNFLHDPSNNNSLIYNDAKAVLPDSNMVWVGTHGEGLAAYDKINDRFIHYQNNSFFPFQMHDPAWINDLFKDSRKRLWISTYNGLFVFDGKKLYHFQHSPDSSSISSNSVNMVIEDNSGKIWVISEFGGLDQYDEKNKKFIRFTGKYNLPETMKAIVADRNDRLWISSNQGIVVFDQQQHKVKTYDAADGLPGNTFFQKAVLKAKNGTLYFGGPQGFSAFNPDSLKPVRVPSYFYFTDLYIYDKLQQPGKKASPLKEVLSFTDKLTLTQKQSFFSIGFAAIDLYAPAKTQYAYMLEGLHNQWINLKTERKVSFTNLDPGNYILKVRYTDANGEWRVAKKSLDIIILPPWWKTWWFKLLIVLLLASSIVTLFYLRVASIKRRNKALKAEVEKRTGELNEANLFLTEQNDEIKLQKERLEESNEEIRRQSGKILDQQQYIITQNQALESTVKQLEKLNNTKDLFFSILAHDLKNPVAALIDISDFLKHNFGRMDIKTSREYLDSIYKSSTAVHELLINLLNWSRTQSHQIEYSPVDCSVRELVEKNARLLGGQFHNKNIRLTLHIDASHRVYADYNMVDTVLRNIISNSVKFTEPGGTVEITSIAEEDHFTLQISDTGVGMSSEQIGKLFRIDKANISAGTAGERGTGLGLVITKEFLQINKGGIRVESRPGKGSVFFIRLPKSTWVANSTTASANAVLADLSPDLWEALPIDQLIKVRGKKILIVDDNRELRDYLKLILSGIFEIFEAENGGEGLKIALETQPAVIITDFLMPVMNGLQFCKAIKSTTATSHIPVIFLTGQWEDNKQASGYEAGADAYLTKPVKRELLLQLILNFMKSGEKIREKIRDRILNDEPSYPEDTAISKLDEEFLNQLIGLIEADMKEAAIDTRSLCRKMAISRTVLYTKVKILTGQTVHEFIKSIQLKKSLKLLQEGRLTINQVAFEVGFSSHSYFDKCFIKQYGIGPREYINKKKHPHSPDH